MGVFILKSVDGRVYFMFTYIGTEPFICTLRNVDSLIGVMVADSSQTGSLMVEGQFLRTI